MHKLSEDEVKREVEELGYWYIGPYRSSGAPLRTICRCGCGETLLLPLTKLRLKRGCKRCNIANRSAARRLTLDEVKDLLSARGFRYIEGEYVNRRSPLRIACRCGDEFITTLADAQHRVGCNRCSRAHVGEVLRRSIDDVREMFAQYGCELLTDDYRNNRQRLSFRCECGHLATKSANQMAKSKGGCAHCAPERISQKHKARLSPTKQTPAERRAHAAAYARQRGRDDPQYRIRNALRGRVRSAVVAASATKSARTFTLIGCAIEQLKTHLESLFQPGMSWANYGKNGWHIDHIRPCASFDLMDPEQQRLCFHYTNLQPLWWRDNCVKGARQA